MSIENPLEIIKRIPKISTSFKYISNNAGRPKKNKEIKFTPPPKSIITLLLRNEISKADVERNEVQKEDSTKAIERTLERNVKKIDNKNNPVQQDGDKLKHCAYINCSYSTNSSSNLIKHTRIHTSEKPYACDKCIFRTNFQNSLRVHQRIHTLEKPYECQYCDYRCNSSSNLKKHCKHKH